MLEIVSQLKSEEWVQILSAFVGAFSAFVLFILGEYFLRSNKKRDEILFLLEESKEYVASVQYEFELNKRLSDQVKTLEPISIFLNQMRFFPIQEKLYLKFKDYKLAETLIRFSVDLRVLNDSAVVLNSFFKEHSDLSRIAMIDRRENEFLETMTKDAEHINYLMDKYREHLDASNKKIPRIIDEINFTIWYVKSYFWTKMSYLVLSKILKRFDTDYREIMIKKIVKKYPPKE